MFVQTLRHAAFAAAAFSLAVSPGCGSDQPAPQAIAEAEAAEPTPAAKPTPPARVARLGAPVVNSVKLVPSAPIAGEHVSAIIDVDDPGGDVTQVGYVWWVSGKKLKTGQASVVIPEDARRGDALIVEVRAANDIGTSQVARGEGQIGNTAPEWRSLTLSHHGEVPSGTKIEARPVVVDRDLDPVEITVTWILNGEYVAQGEYEYDTSELERGDELRVVVEATDGDLEVEERESDSIKIANGWPKIVSAPASLGEDGRIQYQLEIEDPDGDRRFRYELVSGPPDMELDGVVGELRWQATRKHVGVHTVEILVKDMYGGEARQRFDLTVSEAEGDAAPAAPAS